MVDSDLVSGTSRLYRALSADDAVFALSQTCAASCVHQVLVTSDGYEWRTMADQIRNADSVEDLGFADGRYVAVGMAGGAAIWTSLGSLWSRNEQPTIFDAGADGGPAQPSNHNDVPVRIHALATGPGGWLAGGSVSCDDCLLEPGDLPSRYAAWLSADGHTWSRAPWHPGPASINRLAFNGTTYVALDNEGLWNSADAEHWQRVLEIDPETASMVDVAERAGEFLAVAHDTPQAVAIWTSTDGSNWTRVPPSAEFGGVSPVRLQSLSGRWVLVGSREITGDVPAQSVWTSTDGQTWSRQTVATNESGHVADAGAIGQTLVASGWLGDGGPSTMGAAWVGSLP